MSTPHLKVFNWHSVVYYAKQGAVGKVYDPSYGKVYEGNADDLRMKDIEDQGIAFYAHEAAGSVPPFTPVSWEVETLADVRIRLQNQPGIQRQ
jgi:hypothetical protein